MPADLPPLPMPVWRPRRLRQSPAIRELVAENRLHPSDLVLPIFAADGLAEPRPISTMPGVVQHSEASYKQAVQEAWQAGVRAIMPFGVPKDEDKDACGSGAVSPDGILTRSVRWAHEACPEMVIIADLCLDEFTDHGHCGVLADDGSVDNDATLQQYCQMGLVLAEAGAQFLGMSGMMDGQVGAMRHALDHAGYTNVGVLAYAAKYASGFYGPFREAVGSSLKGDRRTYQQDPANLRESLREIALDVEEGADIIMVKPGLPYLDVLAAARDMVEVPVATYVVSGEFAMIEFAAAAGAIDRRRTITEALLSAKRAGAGIIATYWATEVATWLKEKA